LKIVFAVIAVLLFAVPASAFARGVSSQDLLEVTYSGPVFLDAFWTDRTSPPPQGEFLEKVEVGPGDGASVLAVTLVNRGLSDITSVTGFLTLPSGFRASGTDSREVVATSNEVVEAGGVFTLFFQVDVLDNTSVKEYSADLKVNYSRISEVGQFRTAEISFPFLLTGRVILDASAANRLAPGESSEVTMILSNKGSAPATAVVVTLAGSTGITDTVPNASAISTGQKTFDIGVIEPGQSTEFQTSIFASKSSSETLQTMNLDIAYGNAYGVRKTMTVPVGLIVQPKPPESVLSVAPIGNSSNILSGKIVDLDFVISNIGGKPLSDVIISLEPQSESVQILGESKWIIKEMAANYNQKYTTKVFAANDLISKPTSFDVVIEYLLSGEAKKETLNLGAYVDGEITVRAYEIEVTYIGGRPNITGNLLNEGNVLALFTTIEITSADGLTSSLPPQQYLGDLSENSPLPFSIPIVLKDGVSEGVYPVSLKVQYKDSLRELHTFDVIADVPYKPDTTATNSSANDASSGSAMILVGIGIAIAAIVAIILIRRKKRSALTRTLAVSKENDENIESVLDRQMDRSDDLK
jgi:hypothetical protein